MTHLTQYIITSMAILEDFPYFANKIHRTIAGLVIVGPLGVAGLFRIAWKARDDYNNSVVVLFLCVALLALAMEILGLYVMWDKWDTWPWWRQVK